MGMKTNGVFLDILKERKELLTKIYDTIGDLKLDVETDLELHILKHIEACAHPDKLVNPEKIKVKITRENDEVEEIKTDNKCPLTQTEINDPYESTCGHRFERRAII